MPKIDWLIICADMMIEYIPQEIGTWDNYNIFQDICEHFIRVSTAFSGKIKAERNINQLMIDDDETIGKLAQIMNRLALQGLGFAKSQHEENKIITTSALRKYEAMLENENLNESQQTALRNGIRELRFILDGAED